jgi:transaldolase/glucose-6-phosphate isomerase
LDSRLQQLVDAGQSIWLDNIRRSMFSSGELRTLIRAGLRGMTSNPTIFEKAIGSGSEYDEQLQSLIGEERDPNSVFEALAVADIRDACDEFRSLYDATAGGDGYVSLEVSPLLARDTAGTIAAAKRLWAVVDRPNVMIKIPGTPECCSAITESIAAGININVTLLFSIEQYEAAANAYVAGIEKRLADGKPVDRIASVASVFVSRIDTAVDKLLEAKLSKGEPVADLLGKTGVANLKLIYQRFRRLFESDRFAPLKARGARVQRPLWASTSTKNPNYPDLMYVETVIGPETVNTVPPATLDALMDHGHIVPDTVQTDIPGAAAVLEGLARAQISLFDVTLQLQVDGVKAFSDSYDAMLAAITYKQDQLMKVAGSRVQMSLGAAQGDVDAALDALAKADFLQKLWRKDPAPWSGGGEPLEGIRHALGWLDFPERVLESVGDLTAFAGDAAQRFGDAVVLGMGGSSLAPDVLRRTLGTVEGFPRLHVLDSSDPDQIKALDEGLEMADTLFIVASKSGTTTEPQAFLRYFYDRVAKAVGTTGTGDHFIAITDAKTPLQTEAQDDRFLRTFINDPDIGGRYSALSYFGMVPAAIAGYDVRLLIDRGIGGLMSNARTTDPHRADGVRFGAALAALAKAGRDKLTIICHPIVESFGTWAEQLIAESTGKRGVGIVPVEGEPLGTPEQYGDDRVFVYVGHGLPDDDVKGDMDGSAIEARLAQLEAAGHPVVRMRMTDAYDIGEQFAVWEIATAAAGAVLGIDAFDQPNVQESKDITNRLLDEYRSTGSFGDAGTVADAPVTPLGGSRMLALGKDLQTALAALFGQVEAGDYVAINAYIDMDPEHVRTFRGLRVDIRNGLRVATTVGFGPRFLHSTGQLHKGGPPTGVFLELTTEPASDLPIPGMGYGFRTLLRAQALGDFEALDRRGRRGLRLHLAAPLDASLAALAAAVADAVSATA